MINRLLYLTYIPLDKVPTSGSSVRPLKMKEAFERTELEVKCFGGVSNNISIRKQTVKKIRKLLLEWKPDACYIEPPSGPFFYSGDLKLIKFLHKKQIPISIFYRDAYWKYPKDIYGKKRSVTTFIKGCIIKVMQQYQWNEIKKTINLIYFPSVSMAKEFDCPNKDVLPPGGFFPIIKERKNLTKPLQFIFVGGAAERLGTFLMLDSFEKLNNSEIKAKLIFVCPKDQWDTLNIDIEKYEKWLNVYHLSGDESLKSLYEKSDVAIHLPLKSVYTDFAVPIKVFEYLSYLKPMIMTDCFETTKFIEENGLGWIVKDNVDSVVNQLDYLCSNIKEIELVKNQMEVCRTNNSWECRVKKVIDDLTKMVK